MSIANALAALETAIDVHEAAFKKLRRVIRRKRMNRKDFKKEQREQARVGRKLSHLEDLLAEYEAASFVISAPTKAEIKSVAKHIAVIRDIAIQDAMVAAGFNTITTALKEANDLANKNKKT